MKSEMKLLALPGPTLIHKYRYIRPYIILFHIVADREVFMFCFVCVSQFPKKICIGFRFVRRVAFDLLSGGT